MMQTDSKAQQVLSVVVVYGIWLISAALALWLMLQMRLLFLVDLPQAASTINPWAFSAIDKFGFFFLGLIWLIFLVVTEEYFRRMVGRRFKIRAVAGVFIVEGVLLGLVYLWRALL